MAASKKNGIVTRYFERVSWKLLEKHRPIIKDMIRGHAGIYALYKRDKLYYVGLATNMMNRVNHHLKDRHKGKWDGFSVYLTERHRGRIAPAPARSAGSASHQSRRGQGQG